MTHMILTRRRRGLRVAAALALAALAAGCADPAPSILGQASPPMGAASLPPATVGLSLGQEAMPGVSAPATQRGMTDYFARHIPQWTGGAPSAEDDLRLVCDIDQEGTTNCSDTLASCELMHAGAVVESFQTRRESETCMMGGDGDAYQAQAYNDGVALAGEIARRVRQDPDLLADLTEAAQAEELAEASRTGDRDTLERIRDERPGTQDALVAEAALARLDREAEAARLEAERLAEEQALADAAEAEAAQEAAAAQPSAQPSAQSAAPQAAAQAPAAAVEEANPLPGEDYDPGADLRLSCYSAANNICGDYEFPSKAERDDFAARCRSMGSQVLEGGRMCDRRNAACLHRNGGTTVFTWVYGLPASQVNAQCASSGGRSVAP
ncbi:hypothetical protein [uncultured Albimonas sp.]|uniref:hypothetical protein n=1 Tax=uncultured Albimonas sp. TaxID=1331701 RepID=UPI0030ECBC03